MRIVRCIVCGAKRELPITRHGNYRLCWHGKQTLSPFERIERKRPKNRYHEQMAALETLRELIGPVASEHRSIAIHILRQLGERHVDTTR